MTALHLVIVNVAVCNEWSTFNYRESWPGAFRNEIRGSEQPDSEFATHLSKQYSLLGALYWLNIYHWHPCVVLGHAKT